VDHARPNPAPPARDRFLALLRTSVRAGQFTKLTLGKHRGADATLRNLLVRPVNLKAGLHLSLVWRHATRDITKNLAPDDGLALLERLIGTDFLDAHLFTVTQNAQFESDPGPGRLKIMAVTTGRTLVSGDLPDPTGGAGLPCESLPASRDKPAPTVDTSPKPVATGHDRARQYLLPANTPWLRALGITNAAGSVREGQSAKFRQINKFAELLTHLLPEAFPGFNSADFSDLSGQSALRITDMGCGKGYLTFAVATLLGRRAQVTGVEVRPELVTESNRTAADHGFTNLTFVAGQISDLRSQISNSPDVLIALHACDTATDDAIAQGIATSTRLLLLSPCCQKELRPQLTAPPVLAPALRHGIFQERQSEFVTDALRALLLEWAGYRTKVFEFISTEHTAKNLMIAAVRTAERQAPDSPAANQIRAFAAFYGIRRQRLAEHLGFPLPKS
jgi:SAM-dependent methyltransferase